jgi:hypothetical protein
LQVAAGVVVKLLLVAVQVVVVLVAIVAAFQVKVLVVERVQNLLSLLHLEHFLQ